MKSCSVLRVSLFSWFCVSLSTHSLGVSMCVCMGLCGLLCVCVCGGGGVVCLVLCVHAGAYMHVCVRACMHVSLVLYVHACMCVGTDKEDVE